MPEEIRSLEERVRALEQKMNPVQVNFEQAINDAVFFDVDNVTVPSVIATANLVNGHVTIGAIPTKFVRIRYKGQVYNMALYSIT